MAGVMVMCSKHKRCLLLTNGYPYPLQSQTYSLSIASLPHHDLNLFTATLPSKTQTSMFIGFYFLQQFTISIN